MKTPTMLRPLRMLLMLALAVTTAGFAPGQSSEPARWARVDPADLAMRYYPDDPSAPALVLSDYQIVGYHFDNTAGFQLRSLRHRRVKYFEQFAYSRSPVKIEWYEPLEKVSRLQALLHFPNGKVRRLRKKNFRVESLGNDWKQYVLELPKLPAGTILEYRFMRSSEIFDRLPDWYFQEQYPVRRSEYRSLIPEWFDYVALASPDSRLLTLFSQKPFALLQTPYGYVASQVTRNANYLRLVAESLPAIQEESYTNNAFDYIPQLRMQLRSITWPGDTMQALYPTWSQLADTLRWDPNFGLRYLDVDQIDTVRRALAPHLRAATSPGEKIRSAYRAISEHLSWDGTYSSQSARSPDAVWTARTGNSGELNLLLLAVLRDLDLPAFPVLVGTRDNGVVNETLAQRTPFDHVLVLTLIDDQVFLIDVGDSSRPIGLPRTDALNNRGWLIFDDRQLWIDLLVPPSEQVVVAQLSLDTSGYARGEIAAGLSGYYAAFARERLQRAATSASGPLVDVLSEYYPEATFDRTVANLDSNEAPLRISLDGGLALARHEGDQLSFAPVLFPSLSTDLLTARPRQFPLDMPFPWSEQFRLVLDLPPGYTLTTSPDPVELRSPDEQVSFAYQVRQNDRQLILEYRLAVAKTFYTPEEYETTIRDLFFTAIDRQEGLLVLRREVPAD